MIKTAVVQGTNTIIIKTRKDVFQSVLATKHAIFERVLANIFLLGTLMHKDIPKYRLSFSSIDYFSVVKVDSSK